MQPVGKDANFFVDRQLDDSDMGWLKNYTKNNLVSRQPIDVISSAKKASASCSQAFNSRSGIAVKGSLLNLLATAADGCQHKLYLGRHVLPKEKCVGLRALERIPAGTCLFQWYLLIYRHESACMQSCTWTRCLRTWNCEFDLSWGLATINNRSFLTSDPMWTAGSWVLLYTVELSFTTLAAVKRARICYSFILTRRLSHIILS